MFPWYMKKRKPKKKSDDLDLFPKAKRPTGKKPADLTKKLDKVFSAYIRLRDAMPNGCFRCISCGQIKRFEQGDCGHYHSRTHMATRWEPDNCHMECRACLTPDTLILMKDLKWKQLGELKEGEEIFAFDEENGGRANRRRYRVGQITHIHREVRDVYEVTLENGDVVKTTADHKWLCRNRGPGYKWIETQDMWCNGKRLNGRCKSGPKWGSISTTVCKIINVVHQEQSYEAGWIAGMLDADGHICQQNIHDTDGTIRYGFRVGIAQCEKYMDICEDIKKWLEYFTGNHKTCRQTMENIERRRTFKCQYQTWQFLITGSNIEKLQFLQRVRPHKIKKVDIEKLGYLKSQYDTKVSAIKYIGKQEIVVMETSTHTYIANGYAMHNCNRVSSDHLIGYRRNLVEKIGLDRINRLEMMARSQKHWLDFELQEKIDYFTREVKRLSAEKGINVKI